MAEKCERNLTDWVPSPKQAALLEAAHVMGYGRNIEAICAQAGVSKVSFYKWIKVDLEFKDAWNNIWRSAIHRHLPGVILAQLQKAHDGDTQAAKFIAEMAGELRTKIEATGKDGSPLMPPKLNIYLHGSSSSRETEPSV